MFALPTIVMKPCDEVVDIGSVDQMLMKITSLLKKALMFKKIQREIDQNKLSQTEIQNIVIQMKKTIQQMSCIKEAKPISDKGITNLFYFRIQKQINFYKKAISKLQKLVANLQKLYEKQEESSEFNLNQIFLLSHKLIVQILLASKTKSEQKVKQLKNIRQNNQFNFLKANIQTVDDQEKMLKQFEQIEVNRQKDNNNKFILKPRFSIQAYTSDIIKENNLQESYKCDQINFKIGEDSTLTTSLHLQLKNQNNHLEKLKKLNEPHILRLYSCLDIDLELGIYNYFIQTLPPKDNIDFIIKKMHFTNKKQRKQIKQYITCYNIYETNKQQKYKIQKNSSFTKYETNSMKMKMKKSLSDFSRIKSRSNNSFNKSTTNFKLKINKQGQNKLKSISNSRFNINSKKEENIGQKKNNILKQNLIKKNLMIQNSDKSSKIEYFNKNSLNTMFRTYSKKQPQNQRQSPKLKL